MKNYHSARNLKDAFRVSESLRLLIRHLSTRQGQEVTKDEIKKMLYFDRRWPRLLARRQSDWKDKSSKFWSLKKDAMQRRTKDDILMLIKAGILYSEHKQYGDQKVYTVGIGWDYTNIL